MTFVLHDFDYYQLLGLITDFIEKMVDVGCYYLLLYYTLRRFDWTSEEVLSPLAVLLDWH